jgi:hypothetical protein
MKLLGTYNVGRIMEDAGAYGTEPGPMMITAMVSVLRQVTGAHAGAGFELLLLLAYVCSVRVLGSADVSPSTLQAFSTLISPEVGLLSLYCTVLQIDCGSSKLRNAKHFRIDSESTVEVVRVVLCCQ